MDEVANGSRGSSYAALKKLDPMPSDKNSNFTLPAHDEEDLWLNTSQQFLKNLRLLTQKNVLLISKKC